MRLAMGLLDKLRSLIHRVYGSRRRPRRTANDKLKMKVRELAEKLDVTSKERDEWKLKAGQSARRIADLEEQLQEARKRIQLVETENEVLTTEKQGQAKMIVAQQTFIDAATARASAEIARVTNGAGGSLNANALFPRD